MARFSPKLSRMARKASKLLPPLLRATRNDLELAKLELKWIKSLLPAERWVDAVTRRSLLEPLQYILGTQPFGALDIMCRENVLIPRWETEEWCQRLANTLVSIRRGNPLLNLLECCCGSGCILLLLHHQVTREGGIPTNIFAFDVSNDAIQLAQDNLEEYQGSFDENVTTISFKKLDVFDRDIVNAIPRLQEMDLVVSNPPYISKQEFDKPLSLNGVEKSVKMYEPRLALVGDLEFYDALLYNIVLKLKVPSFVFEVGSESQVQRVQQILKSTNEDWRCGKVIDSAGNVRCVVGWHRESSMNVLHGMCDEVVELSQC